MVEGSRATRRTVLRSGLFAVGLAGLAGLAGLGERFKTAGVTIAAPTSGSTLRLYGTDWRLSAPALRRGDLPRRGDLVSVTGSVSLQPGSEPAGDFFASAIHLDGTSGHGPYSAVQQETHTFRLTDGTIVGMGTNLLDGESTYAIVGGTGRFAGVTGSYIGTQSPLDVGGDGTAEFTFTFFPGR